MTDKADLIARLRDLPHFTIIKNGSAVEVVLLGDINNLWLDLAALSDQPVTQPSREAVMRIIGVSCRSNMHDLNRDFECKRCSTNIDKMLALFGSAQPVTGPRQVHPGDWPEDFRHENGNYCGKCVGCEREFIGHKRRVFCKVCALGVAPKTDEADKWRERYCEDIAKVQAWESELVALRESLKNIRAYCNNCACDACGEILALLPTPEET